MYNLHQFWGQKVYVNILNQNVKGQGHAQGYHVSLMVYLYTIRGGSKGGRGGAAAPSEICGPLWPPKKFKIRLHLPKLCA